MKIAIYGDSYTAGQVNKELNSEPSWIELLSEKFDNITLFGRGGSSVYYSYKTFLQTHFEFDKVIFFATFSQRLYVNNKHLPPSRRHIPGLHARNFNYENSEVKLVAEAAEKYFLHLHDINQTSLFRSLMLKDLKERRPDIMIFDIEYYVSICEELKNYNQVPDQVFSKYTDLRHMHFSLEKNIAVANIFIDNLTNNKQDIDYELIKNAAPSKKFEDYFILHEQLPKIDRVVPVPGVTIKELP